MAPGVIWALSAVLLAFALFGPRTPASFWGSLGLLAVLWVSRTT
jgi:hypothetical protein